MVLQLHVRGDLVTVDLEDHALRGLEHRRLAAEETTARERVGGMSEPDHQDRSDELPFHASAYNRSRAIGDQSQRSSINVDPIAVTPAVTPNAIARLRAARMSSS